MNSSTHEKSEYNVTYDPNVAFEFFKLFGKVESAKQGEKLFVKGQKAGFFQSEKTYLLLQGEVSIETDAGKSLELNPGQILGDYAAYTPRNASATAKTPSNLISLSEKQLLNGLQKQPGFLLMLMDVLVKYLEKTDNGSHNPTAPSDNSKDIAKDSVLSSKMINELKERLGDTAIRSVPANEVIFQEGTFALLMYVILDGHMNICVGDKVIRQSGPGEIVGEIALLSQHSRTANVITATRCSVLSINRQNLMVLIETLPSFGIALLRVLASRSHIRNATADYTPENSTIFVEEGEYKDSDWQ